MQIFQYNLVKMLTSHAPSHVWNEIAFMCIENVFEKSLELDDRILTELNFDVGRVKVLLNLRDPI